jgi:hypothetical protein
MPEKISWSLNVQVPGGPKLASSQNLDVDAYDKIVAVIPHGGTDHTVDVQPGDATHVKFLLISSDRYTDLSYKPKDGTEGTSVKLDAQQLFLGAGSVGLLDKAPKQLVFKNADPTHDATVQILVGRTV